MRTTTKRGLGRSATLNGNGHAVLPPAVLEPQTVTRYRQPPPPPRSRARLAASIFGWIVLALLVVVSGLAGGLYLYGHETLGALAVHTKQGKATAADKNVHKVASPTQPATALIIGYDTRKGADASAGQSSRSDTIMLVRADPTNKTLSLLSFPRDLQTAIYCNGSDVPRTNDRINSAWSTCGEQGTLDTVAHLTNVPINYVITVDFHGFKLLVNKLHGVFIDVDHRYINTVSGPGGYAKIDLHPGYQKLDGQEALDFVRFRHTDSDLYRLARQQLFLDALKDRLSSSFHLTEIPGLIGAVKGSVEVAQAGGGAPNLDVIQAYVGLMYGLPAGHLFRTEIPNLVNCGFENAQVCTSQSDVDQAVNTFMHPDVTVSQRANDQTLGIKPTTVKVRTLKPAEITTLVLNGSTQLGMARDTSFRLAQAGFATVHLPANQDANTARSDYYDSYVYYDPIQAQGKSAATTLAKWLGAHVKVAAFPSEIATFAQQAGNPLTVLVIGSAFDGNVTDPQAAVQAPPAKQPAQVSTYDASPYVPSTDRTPFPMLLPRIVSSGSRISSLEGVRLFKPSAGNKELVFTFVTAAGNVYYQVIETNWTSAPILRNPTGKFLDKKTGRMLDLFTTSGKIHMIVFRKHGATYWVVNTLRDELSNETMLAIARGLQPVAR